MIAPRLIAVRPMPPTPGRQAVARGPGPALAAALFARRAER